MKWNGRDVQVSTHAGPAPATFFQILWFLERIPVGNSASEVTIRLEIRGFWN
jgi:hypothetical protein